MQMLSIFDIIGPVMIGPSSSHTAGALRIASLARAMVASPLRRVEFILYGSFAHTYRGHGTDRALAAGILGFDTRDDRIPDAIEWARRAGIDIVFVPDTVTEVAHPNTVDLLMTCEDGSSVRMRGISTGGGAARIVRIGNVDIDLSGERNTIFVAQRDVSGVLAFISSCIGEAGINIATAAMYREARGTDAYTILETDEPIGLSVIERIEGHPAIRRATLIELPGQAAHRLSETDVVQAGSFDFTTGAHLLELCERSSFDIGSVMLAREVEMGTSDSAALRAEMAEDLSVMRRSVSSALETDTPSMGGFLGGQARALMNRRAGTGTFSGQLLSRAVAYALGVLETNARMGLIVAAPTAGSSGVVPGVLLACQEERGFTEDALVGALFNAAAVGYLMARNASVSGAAGGCQAEVGAASAMAASALVQLGGGTPAQCLDAAAMALTNVLGLVCDPVLGLVEEPCQKRNAVGVADAIVSADMALAGITCVVGVDDAIRASDSVGRSLPRELRETALGGVAGCYCAQAGR